MIKVLKCGRQRADVKLWTIIKKVNKFDLKNLEFNDIPQTHLEILHRLQSRLSILERSAVDKCTGKGQIL